MFLPNTIHRATTSARTRRWTGVLRTRGYRYAIAALGLAVALLFAAGASAQDQTQIPAFQFGNSPAAQGATSSGFQFDSSASTQDATSWTSSSFNSSSSNSVPDPFHRWTENIGAGFSPLIGDIHSRLNNGWHVTGGAGYRFNRYLSLGGQVMYNGFGVSNRLLREVDVPAGNAHLWAFTAQPMLQFAPRHGFDPYVVGGVGYYRRVVQFTRPTFATVDVFDPFFFGFLPVVIPANQVIGTIVRDGIGGSAGAGVNWRIGGSFAQVFLEVRYHYADVGSIVTRMIPVTIGLRF